MICYRWQSNRVSAILRPSPHLLAVTSDYDQGRDAIYQNMYTYSYKFLSELKLTPQMKISTVINENILRDTYDIYYVTGIKYSH